MKSVSLKSTLLFSIVIYMSLFSCKKDDTSPLSEYQIETISYFKEIALGFEFGNASNITRKWSSELKIFVKGKPQFGIN